MHQIENSFLKVQAREYGAELTSIYDKKNKLERLWQADKNVWGWHSPILFPVVGRCLNDEITIEGVKYPMEKHGFGRRSTFKLLDREDHKMVFSLKWSEETFKAYPYKFELLVAYRLDGNTLIVSFEVVNDDKKEIYFSIGGHPAFAAPLLAGEKYEDYYLEFEKSESALRHLIDGNGYFDGRHEAVLNNENKLHLKEDMFNDDALIFKQLNSRTVSLKSSANPHYLKVDFNGFNELGVWAKPKAPYVCIEPWLGYADALGQQGEFKDKPGIISLKQGGEFGVSYKIEVG